MSSVGHISADDQVQYIYVSSRGANTKYWDSVKNINLWGISKALHRGLESNSKLVITQGVLPGAWVPLESSLVTFRAQ